MGKARPWLAPALLLHLAASYWVGAAEGALADELAVVGPVKNVLKVGCQRFTQLVLASETNIAYDPSTATSMPNRMSERLFERLKVLAVLVSDDSATFGNGTMLRVLEAYIQPPDDAAVANTHFEGRAADITVTGAPTAGQLTALQAHAAAAGIEWILMEPATNETVAHLHVSVIADKCYAPLDLVFLLDGSGSIDKPQFGGEPGNFQNKVLGFVKDMVEYFTIGQSDTRVGVVTFANSVTQNFKLDE